MRVRNIITSYGIIIAFFENDNNNAIVYLSTVWSTSRRRALLGMIVFLLRWFMIVFEFKTISYDSIVYQATHFVKKKNGHLKCAAALTAIML